MTTAPGTRTPPTKQDLLTAVRPLAIDVGIPLGLYYLLHSGFGTSVWLALVLSSISPAVRAVASLAARHAPNRLAMLMLAVNLAGIVVSVLSGDPRAMIAKDSLVSSVIAVAILVSVATRRPLMSEGLKPFLTKGRPDRTAAWDRLTASSARFRRFEALFSIIWGLALLADCAARLAGAYTLPVGTMVWLGTVLIVGTIVLASLVSGVASAPMDAMISAEAAAGQPGTGQAGTGQPDTGQPGAHLHEDCEPAGMTKG